MLQGLVAEGCAAGRVAVREALTSELPSIVLVYRHESACELAVLEEAVDVTIEAEEEKVTVLLCGRNFEAA